MRPRVLLVFLFSLLVLPLHAEVRAAARGGFYTGSGSPIAGSVELEARLGEWSLTPAYEVIQGGYGLHAVHVDVRRFFPVAPGAVFVGGGASFVSSNESSEKTWNAEGGFEWRTKSGWNPFVAARYFRFDLPVFRDELQGKGAVISGGVSHRLF